MSMTSKLRRISANEIHRVRQDEAYRLAVAGQGVVSPDARVPDHIYGQLPWYIRLLYRWTAPRTTSSAKQRFTRVPNPPDGERLDLHKSWHGIHWLISGDVGDQGEFPFRFAIFGEEELGAEDLTGYGPPTLNSPSRVKELADALTGLSLSEVMARYDARRMSELEIYPGGWAEDETWVDDLRRDFGRLSKFYGRAARAGDAVVSWIE